MTDGRKKKRPGLAEQQEIVTQAAVPLFLEHGSQAISIAQICQAADISRPTFYRCFKDKDALLASLYQSSVNQAVEEFIIADAHILQLQTDDLHTAFDAMYEKIFSAPELACLLFREANDPNSPAHGIVNQTFENIADTLLPLISSRYSQAVNKTFFMAVMAANQWIVNEAINQGLTSPIKKQAKEAGWQLVSKVFDLN